MLRYQPNDISRAVYLIGHKHNWQLSNISYATISTHANKQSSHKIIDKIIIDDAD